MGCATARGYVRNLVRDRAVSRVAGRESLYVWRGIGMGHMGWL